MKYRDGVIIAADTRATGGETVMDKNCFKLHYIADNIYCAGAGTAADTEFTTENVSSTLRLEKLSTHEEPLVVTAVTRLRRHLFRYGGYISAALILGGVDYDGSHLHTVWPDGATSAHDFVSFGSGSLPALSVLETEWVPNMSVETAVDLAIKAITFGILNDMGSGSNVDVCVINKDGAKVHRNISHIGEEYQNGPVSTEDMSGQMRP
eukprot:gnl/Chilomastix_caulleri/913.p1 GENE.gnl/Chilomastix_caulleri/913~~gnl/Chilomastix_caulleri/913.p1  ORF type:complete len:208 (+),score=51.31 gnl/Chilomastix_caulleri/913:180-803(+)